MSLQRKLVGGCTGKGFVKDDPRCWRKGRPRSFDQLRRVARELAWQDVPWADGRMVSRIELILRRWSRSKNFREQMYFMKIAYGEPPEAETERLQPGTVLRLHLPHELGVRGPSAF
jgi:hypothetical protein